MRKSMLKSMKDIDRDGGNMITKVMAKMIDASQGNKHDIAHFLKVHAYAALIGHMENIEEQKQLILELTAIVHDIACPLCRQKYGNANGKYQEAESEALLRPFLKEFELDKEICERIIYLVSHHHTYTNVDDVDYQILLEADYLVNADEGNATRDHICSVLESVFQTESGKQLLKSIYLQEGVHAK